MPQVLIYVEDGLDEVIRKISAERKLQNKPKVTYTPPTDKQKIEVTKVAKTNGTEAANRLLKELTTVTETPKQQPTSKADILREAVLLGLPLLHQREQEAKPATTKGRRKKGL